MKLNHFLIIVIFNSFFLICTKVDAQYIKSTTNFPSNCGNGTCYRKYNQHVTSSTFNGYHTGNDIPQNTGDEVKSIRDGIIINSNETMGGFGSVWNGSSCKTAAGGCVVIKHKDDFGNDFYAYYGHINILPTIKNGNSIYAGQTLGSIAEYCQTGSNTYISVPHLHFCISRKYVTSKIGYSTTSQECIDTWENPETFLRDYCNKTAQVNSTFVKSLNQNISIYGGSVTVPKPISIHIASSELPYQFSVSQIKGISIENNVIPNTRLTYGGQTSVDGKFYETFNFTPNSSDLSGLYDGFDFKTLTIKIDNGGLKSFVNNKLYFFNPFSYNNVFTDVDKKNDWHSDFVRKGAFYGLFRGKQIDYFGAGDLLTREQAAKVIVEAGIRLKLLNITNTGRTQVSNVGSEFHPYAQTLYEYGYTNSSDFNGNNAITVGEFSKWLVKVFKIKEYTAPPTWYQISGGRIRVSDSNPELASYMNTLLFTRFVTDKDGVWVVNNTWSFFDARQIKAGASYYNVSGSNLLTRASMAKVLTNLYEFIAKRENISSPFGRNAGTPSEDQFVQIGEMFDNDPIPVTSNVSVPNAIKVTAERGKPIALQYPTSNTSQHYFWSMEKLGADLVIATDANDMTKDNYLSKVVFTAPTSGTQTEWKIYTYVANNYGKKYENFIIINLAGTSGSDTPAVLAPTQQASSINLTNISKNSIDVNWTRGNGNYCIVTCHLADNGPAALPENDITYTGNSDYQQAQQLPTNTTTRVVYAGAGSNVNVTGLGSDSKYRFSVYEYNTAASKTAYNFNNVPTSDATTLVSVPIPLPTAGVSWSASNMQVGQTYTFTNTSYNAQSFKWSISPNATISNPTSSTTTDITFPNMGTYSITLTATNTSANTIDTKTYQVYVYDDNAYKPDYQPYDLNFTTPTTFTQPINISCKIKNNTTLGQTTNTVRVKFVMSTDTVYDCNDYGLGSVDVDVPVGSFTTVNFTPTNLGPGIPAGTYNIIAKVDEIFCSEPNGIFTENNEVNNTTSKELVALVTPPDFTINTLTAPSTIYPNTNFNISGTFQNIGNGISDFAPTTDFVISKDQIFSNDDFMVNGSIYSYSPYGITTANGPIVSGSSSIAKISSNIAAGNYYLIARINNCIGGGCGTSSNIPEINTQNNYKVLPIQVVHQNEPTVSASNFSIKNITNSGLTLDWNRGNGQGCIVLAVENNFTTYDFTPNDGLSYAANPDYNLAPNVQAIILGSYSSPQEFSNVRAVYDGTGNSVNITGLQSGKTYTFSVYEYSLNNGVKEYKQYNENIFSIQAYIPIPNDVSSFKRLIGSTSITRGDSPVFNFIDKNNGYMYNNSRGLMNTTDGGLTWLRPNTTLNQKINYIKGYGFSTAKYFTKDLGLIGTRNGYLLKYLSDFKTMEVVGKDFGVITGLSVVNNTGYLTSKSPLSCLNTGKIYKSTDAGGSWSEIKSISQVPSATYFLNENIGWVTVGGIDNCVYSGVVNSSFSILKTTDGGANWTTYPMAITNINSSISDLYFFDENTGFAVTTRGNVLKTTNSGVSWSEHNVFGTLTTQNYDKFPKIKFFSRNVGFINFRNQKLAKTIDGGITWKIYDIQNSQDGWVGDISILSENELFVGGETGILKTTTGGEPYKLMVDNINSSYCKTNAITLNYLINGNFDVKNEFNVQLSDATGNFTTPTILKAFYNPGNSSIQVEIPQLAVEGSSYKLRIVSTIPNVISNETNAFAIKNVDKASVTITPENAIICPGSSVTFNASVLNGGSLPKYAWKKNGSVVGTTSSYTSTFNDGDDIWVEVTPTGDCLFTTPVVSNVIRVKVTPIDKPFIQGIDNILASSESEGIQWYKNEQPISGATSQFFEIPSSGMYQVKVTKGNCSLLSDIFSATLKYQVAITHSPVDGGSSYSEGYYDENSTITIKAAQNSGYSFTNWTESGVIVSTTAEYSFNIKSNRNLVANYVKQNSPPSVKTKNITLELNEQGNAQVTPQMIDAGTSDDFTPNSELVFSLDKNSFSCGNLGENSVTLTAKDKDGASSTATAKVNVVDKLPPVIVAQNTSLDLSGNSNISLSQNQIISNVKDNCDESPLVTYLPNTFNQTGDYNVTIKAKDKNGNESSKNVLVTIKDSLADFSNLFKIQVTNETCDIKNNGSITITPLKDLDYEYSLNNSAFIKFRNILTLNNLSAGNYNVCIKLPSGAKYCYNLTVGKPLNLVGRIVNTSMNSNSINLSIEQGTAPFIIKYGDQHIIIKEKGNYTLNLNKNVDKIIISSAIACEGVLSIDISNEKEIVIFPNPASEILKIKVNGKIIQKDLSIKVYNFAQQMIINKQFNIEDNKEIEINISLLPTGLYNVVTEIDNYTKSTKFIKK